MDPLSISASVVALLQLTTTVIDYLQSIKDAPKERTQCAIEASNLYSLLVNLRFRLDDGCSNEPWYTAVRALAVQGGPFDQYKSALAQLQPKTATASGLKNFGNAVLWKFQKEEILSILSRMERLKTLVQIALEMDHFKLSQAIKNDTKVIQKAMPIVQTGLQAIQEDQNLQMHRKIMDWISSNEYSAQQSDFIARREEDTGLWFIQSPEFTEWLEGSKQTLFCPGIPGAGKTMIAAITVDHLHKKVQSKDIGVAYLYCNYNKQADQGLCNLLASILRQLVQTQPSIAEPVRRLYELHADGGTRPSLEEIVTALHSVSTNYYSMYVVVDALDECLDRDGTRTQLLAKLRELQFKTNLHLMATSRFIPDIEQEFLDMPRLEIRASNSDVRKFVAGKIGVLPKCVQCDEGLQTSIKDKIVDAVDGMFLLARLYVDSLLDKKTKKRVERTLEQLTKGSHSVDKAYYEAYNEAIKRIEGQLPGDAALAKIVLSWITYAQRPLTTGELCHALAVEIGEEELDRDNIPNVDDLVSVCAGLVTVDEESNIIRLVHYTTQEYFDRIREDWNPTAQQEIASVCLTYLSFKTFRSGSRDKDRSFEERLAQNILLDYAARYWGVHAFPVQEETSELALSFLQNGTLVSCAIQTREGSSPLYKYYSYSQDFPKEVTGLHLAAFYGLSHFINELLVSFSRQELNNADCKDGDSRTPLSWAAENGQVAVVQLLVERDDVDVDSEDDRGRTPLSWAAENGQVAVVQLLVERDDVDIESKDNGGQTPLSWAAELGQVPVVQLLVERDDVDVNLKDNEGQAPLSWAAEWGRVAVVELLLRQEEVEVNTKDDNGRTPLLWAAKNGHVAVVKLLLERDDVNVDSKDNEGQTPLSWAAKNGHVVVVQLLVERDDVDIDSKDHSGRTPLSWAAEKGRAPEVELLLEREEVEVDTEDYNGRTPLYWAVEAAERARLRKFPYLYWSSVEDHEATVKLLKSRSASQNKNSSEARPQSVAAL